ncbi:MAG: putative toxin-antitoxin system toxin component, PIN family [Chitinophagaceae bacterium]|nr:putative toxin-antitoxin system toxin component, PIN family [Chitinophagaceae bacterium]MCW5904850.1 putative toxin-antitoxin system toxin component, PIN family [Chitinophagaceae bacterium]
MKHASIMRNKKFVFDTNIWVTVLLNNETNFINTIVREHDIIIFYCEELLFEVSEVLQRPYFKSRNISIKNAINFIKSVGLFYKLSLPIKKYIPKDDRDDYLIALALQTNSGFVTSGDRHILSQKENLEKKFTKLKIITKAEFEKRFSI